MSEKYLGESINKLGFGLMRLPMNGEAIDMEQTKKMVDIFMENGFTYFDTAYVYIGGKSEVALKEAVTDRYPRESFQAATKLPIWECKSKEDMEKAFQTSLDRAGLDYYDFYLIHALNAGTFKVAEEIDAWGYLRELKAQGKIKNMGFSFHDSAEVLDRELAKHHEETDFIQLQINYVDWESESIESRKCYEVARKYDIPVIVMEPVKGGSLANLVPDVEKIFKDAAPDKSPASWAMRYAASMDGIITVLSGMSNIEQIEDNCKSMKDFTPLSDDERATIDKAVDVLNSMPTIPCTACKYCVEGCPQKIDIPEMFSTMNNATLFDMQKQQKERYNGFVTANKGKASDCIECGACEDQCPQHIKIIEELKNAVKMFED